MQSFNVFILFVEAHDSHGLYVSIQTDTWVNVEELYSIVWGGFLAKKYFLQVRKLPVTWGKMVVFAGYSCFFHHLQLESHDLTAIWQKKWWKSKYYYKTRFISMHIYKKKGRNWVLSCFQQLRSYRDDRNPEPGRNSLLFTNSSKGSFSCRRTIDSPPQCRTFI